MPDLKWWQKAVFYQIYPRSFADSNGDGIGDLPGIIDRLDYLKDLGVDAIWLSPHFPSPQFDCGYDISNYTDVAPEYGDLDTFQRLLEEAHSRDIRLILDLVLNHTSDLHPWFLESRSSLDNPKRDWYVWRDGKGSDPPNNWYSAFGGSAWEYDPHTGQYYYHYFFKEQPDLNWRNPAVRQAMYAAARFWLDMGVDGFRLDAIGTLFEDPDLQAYRGGPSPADLIHSFFKTHNQEEHGKVINELRKMFKHQVDQPEVHEVMGELRSVLEDYDGRILVGETDEIAYCAPDELHMVFNFPLMRTNRLTPAWVRDNQRQRLEGLQLLGCPAPGAWPCNTLGNHDTPRVYTQFGDRENDEQLARLSLALMLTLRGTPFLYNGEEIGMADLILDDIEQFRDMLGVWRYRLERETFGMPEGEAITIAAAHTRDKCRTPMQWSGALNAGFCPPSVKPWLPVHPNYSQRVNVSDQEGDRGSLLEFYRKMLQVRRETPALVSGEYLAVHEQATDYLAFLRVTREQVCLVVLNMFGRSHTLDFSDISLSNPNRSFHGARLLFSSREREQAGPPISRIEISPFEVFIAEIY